MRWRKASKCWCLYFWHMNAFPIGIQAGGAESCMAATVELCSSGGAGASVAVLGCVLSRLGQPVAALEVAQCARALPEKLSNRPGAMNYDIATGACSRVAKCEYGASWLVAGGL